MIAIFMVNQLMDKKEITLRYSLFEIWEWNRELMFEVIREAADKLVRDAVLSVDQAVITTMANHYKLQYMNDQPPLYWPDEFEEWYEPYSYLWDDPNAPTPSMPPLDRPMVMISRAFEKHGPFERDTDSP
jgi:hypothetical protein